MPVVSRSEGMPLDGPGVGPGRGAGSESLLCAKANDEQATSVTPTMRPRTVRSRRIAKSFHAACPPAKTQRARAASVPRSMQCQVNKEVVWSLACAGLEIARRADPTAQTGEVARDCDIGGAPDQVGHWNGAMRLGRATVRTVGAIVAQ